MTNFTIYVNILNVITIYYIYNYLFELFVSETPTHFKEREGMVSFAGMGKTVDSYKTANNLGCQLISISFFLSPHPQTHLFLFNLALSNINASQWLEILNTPTIILVHHAMCALSSCFFQFRSILTFLTYFKFN